MNVRRYPRWFVFIDIKSGGNDAGKMTLNCVYYNRGVNGCIEFELDFQVLHTTQIRPFLACQASFSSILGPFEGVLQDLTGNSALN